MTIAPLLSMDGRATGAVGSVAELAFDLRGDGFRERARGGQQDRRGVHIVLGLRQHVRGDPLGIAFRGDDDDFGGAGDEVDAGVARDQLFRGGDIDVSGTDDAVDARDRFRSVGQRRDGLRSAHLEEMRDAEPGGDAQDLRAGMRAGDAGGLDAGDLRGNHVHQQRGGQGIAAGGRVAPMESSGRTIWPSRRPSG